MTIYVTDPLQLSVFPGLLLVLTLFRLSLNVATTRLILGDAYAGELDELRRNGERLSVEGVPTYVVDGRTIHGVDSTDAVLEALGK